MAQVIYETTDFLETICTEYDAYLLGLYTLGWYTSLLSPNNIHINSFDKMDNVDKLNIKNKTVEKHVGEERKREYPDIKSDLDFHFIRGLFDANIGINELTCTLIISSPHLKDTVQKKIGIPYKGDLEYIGNNALDFLGKLYNNATVYNQHNYDKYLLLCSYISGVSPNKIIDDENLLEFEYKRSRENAVSPFKERISDSGYDLTVVEKIKTNGIIDYYDTGVSVRPPYGWYFDIVPRSSLCKTGYILANSVGIIDRQYTGNIIVALIKIDKSLPDLPLPYRAVQMIPRMIVHMQMREVKDLTKTERGDGGFGSTGNVSNNYIGIL